MDQVNSKYKEAKQRIKYSKYVTNRDISVDLAIRVIYLCICVYVCVCVLG